MGSHQDPESVVREIKRKTRRKFSPDGKYLFFIRVVRGNGDIYWVDAAIIEDVRNRK